MIPMSLITLVAAALWHFSETGFMRWFTSGALVVGAYMLLGKPQFQTKDIGKRTYRFADYKAQVIDLLKRVCTVSVEFLGDRGVFGLLFFVLIQDPLQRTSVA